MINLQAQIKSKFLKGLLKFHNLERLAIQVDDATIQTFRAKPDNMRFDDYLRIFVREFGKTLPSVLRFVVFTAWPDTFYEGSRSTPDEDMVIQKRGFDEVGPTCWPLGINDD